MIRWLKYFLDVCLFKSAPQDAPTSKLALRAVTFFYWSLGTIVLLFTYKLVPAVIVSTLQTGLAIFFIYMVLWIKKEPNRITQSLTAYMGAGIIILIVAIPVFSWIAQHQENLQQIYFIAWLALLIWETAVTGHILRHALSIPFVAGLGVALIFIYLTFAVTVRFVKILSFELN